MSTTLRQYNRHFLNLRPIYALGSWLLDMIHPVIAYPAIHAFTEVAYRVATWARAGLTVNLRHVLRWMHPEWSARELEAGVGPLVHRTFLNRGVALMDMSMLAGRRPLAGLLEYTLEGDWGRLSRHVAAGRGGLLVSAHLGNWHVGSFVAGSHGVQVRSIMYRNHAARAMYAGVGRRAGLAPIFVGDDAFSVVQIVRALRQGSVCAMLSDIPWDSRCIDLPFFGAPARFPIGAVRLARLAGVPLFPAFCVWTKPRQYRAILAEPIEVTGADPDAAEREALVKLVRIYEEIIPQYLPVWFNFAPVWSTNGNGRP